ncbi:MAG: outer membrane beta-barrel protein [Balneolales bacterium]|nr:outer membrane beta-barrel protein [Balneolales bacterium]
MLYTLNRFPNKKSAGARLGLVMLFFMMMPIWSPTHGQQSQTEPAELFVHQTLDQMLSKTPGFYLDVFGDLNYRGIGAGRLDFRLNGLPLASNSGTGRVALSRAFAPDAFGKAYIMRNARAEDWASPLGVSLNLQTAPAIFPEERAIDAAGGVSAFSEYGAYGSIGRRGYFSYSDRPVEGVSIGLRASWNTAFSAFEQLETRYQVADFEGNPTDFLSSVSPSLQIQNDENISGSFWLGYDLSETTSLELSANYFRSDFGNDVHRRVDETADDWINPTESGAQGEMGFTMYEAFTGNIITDQTELQARGETVLPGIELSYAGHWSRSVRNADNLRMPFRRDGLNFLINTDDRSRPFMEIENIPTLENGTVDYRNMRLSFVDEQQQEDTNQLLGGRFDVSLPNLNLKAGVAGRLTTYERDFEQGEYVFFQPLNLYRFFMIPQGDMQVMGQSGYLIPWMVDTEYARSFFQGSRPRFNRNEDQVFLNSEYRNFELQEGLLAGYLQTRQELGPATLYAGLRYEYLSGTYEGFELFEDEEAGWISSGTENTNSYGNLFPFVATEVQVSSNISFEAAYNRGIRRPDFFKLVPFNSGSGSTAFLFRGNSELEPELSDNLYSGFTLQFDGHTAIYLGGFYTVLSNAITETISGGETDLSVLSWQNSSETADFFGVESRIRHRFTYLPRLLSGLGVSANYTWADSRLQDNERGNIRFPGQKEHVLNAGVFYDLGRFNAKLNYQYASGSILAYAQESTQIPTEAEPVFLDLKDSGRSVLSAALQFRISSSFEFWADAWNLLNQTPELYRYSQELYPELSRSNSGISFRTGIRYRM